MGAPSPSILVSRLLPSSAEAWLCALANLDRDGGWILREERSTASLKRRLRDAAARLSPAPRLRVYSLPEGCGVAVQALSRGEQPCRDGDAVWLVDGRSTRRATPEQEEALWDRAGVASCELSGTNIPWAHPTLSVGEALEAGLATEDGDFTLAGAACLASGGRGLPRALLVSLEWFELPREEAEAREERPSWIGFSPPPLHRGIEALAVELALRGVGPGQRQDIAIQLLREVLFNAVGHRSYHARFQDEAVVVRSWSNAIEVVSPGLLPRSVEVSEGWLRGRWSRNPRLMGQLTRHGCTHQQGIGRERIPGLAGRLGWTVSVFEDGEAVCYLLERTPQRLRSTRETRQRTSRDELHARVLALLRERPPMKAAEIAEQLGVPGSTVRRALKQLHDDGRVEKTILEKSSPRQQYFVKR